MIDLHMHTTHSDGSLTLTQLLRRAEEKGLTAISITDHNTVAAYRELERNSGIRKLFSGKIIRGVELSTTCEGNIIEILCFGYDLEKMEKQLNVYLGKTDYEAFLCEKINEKLESMGLTVNYKPMATAELLRNIWADHKDFLETIDAELTESVNCLWRKGFSSSKSPLGIDFGSFYNSYDEVIEIIRKSGGKAFLAHPAEYRKNAEIAITKTKDLIDGIECFHPSADKDYAEELVMFCKKNNLLISGGSDFHGKVKPDVELGLGKGDLYIPKELITWIDNEENIN